ncbi:hypothetical protein K503DRAFT_242475 [Rhizopogon vinicolor AM-OR11-026]|uniref:RFX-type winged-helix domain-containing protein n=1 Tax=Rhizopogon vinicolor AM-OR11-026 TaxID=1314800 RepID=A0A1B7NDV7_9AGAM|nr:hypothetical protein K503DRAFT_242475 [Rhizopogon vinicolor AM-OR11-026]
MAVPARTGTATPGVYRQYGQQQPVQRVGPNVTDDYERWYTEATSSNRMVLSIRSGIHSEIAWALDRLYRLCANDQFILKTIPGLTDALFEWPEWYAAEGYLVAEKYRLFAMPDTEDRKRRHALESIFILRNSATNEPNAYELAHHPRTLPLLFDALSNLIPDTDMNAEFVLNAMELLQAISAGVVLRGFTSKLKDPLPTLLQIAGHSSNRSLIIASLSLLAQLFSNTQNIIRLDKDSPALTASLRYLPLFVDRPLVEASLNYLYAHLSHSPMAKAFLHHPLMPSTLRVLVSFLLSEQVEETVNLDISADTRAIPATSVVTPIHDLTKEELETLIPMPEPQRCYEWMKIMFVATPEGELTQVDFWNLYKDAFTPFADHHPVLVASDVIKNVNVVFPQAQAMVLPGPPQRFIVRGVDRRKDTQVAPRFKCLWDRSQCSAAPFETPRDLYEHILEHLESSENPEPPCLWATCPLQPTPKQQLRPHILTHLSSSQTPAKHPTQDDMITVASDGESYPFVNPTTRQPPPPRHTSISYTRPVADPPSAALTALLIIRILFRSSFVATTDTAPRADGDHFGFPGVVEDDEGDDVVEDIGGELEGERRGRRAFVGVRRMMEDVRMKDETLMSWIVEMVNAAYDGLPRS